MTSDVLVLEVIDLSGEDAETTDVPICIPCLRREKLYCDIHNSPELIINNPGKTDDPDDLCLFSACLKCSQADAERLSPEIIEEYRMLVMGDDCPNAFLDAVEDVGPSLLDSPISDDLEAAFAVMVAARLYDITLDQAATRLVIGIGSPATLH